MAGAGPRKVTQQEFDAKLRELVDGDWAKLENDDPELMAEMRKFLGIADTGAARDDADVPGPLPESSNDDYDGGGG